jgi:hypothetical protein
MLRIGTVFVQERAFGRLAKDLEHVVFVDENSGFAAAESGAVYRFSIPDRLTPIDTTRQSHIVLLAIMNW